MVDFGKLRRALGYQTGWLMSKLLDGDRPVSVTARVRSAAGRATVDLERVEISGVAVDGRTLDFLIQNILLPLYPNACWAAPSSWGTASKSWRSRPLPWPCSSDGKQTGSDERIPHRHASVPLPVGQIFAPKNAAAQFDRRDGRVGERASTEMPAHSPLVEPDMRISRHSGSPENSRLRLARAVARYWLTSKAAPVSEAVHSRVTPSGGRKGRWLPVSGAARDGRARTC